MFLVLTICGLSALYVAMPIGIKKIISVLSLTPQEKMATYKEITQLKQELEQVSITENFATHARIQRKINKLEAELQKEMSSNNSQYLTIKYTAFIISKLIVGILLLCCTLYYRYTPVITFPEQFCFSPLEKIISFPIGQPGIISTPMWIIISNAIVNSLVIQYNLIEEQ